MAGVPVDFERPYRIAACSVALAVQAVMLYLIATSRVEVNQERFLYVLRPLPTMATLHAFYGLYLVVRLLRDASAEDRETGADLPSGVFVVVGIAALAYLYDSFTVYLVLLLTGSVIAVERYRHPHKIAVISALCGALVAVAAIQDRLPVVLVLLLYWASAVLALSVLHLYERRYFELSDRSEKAFWSATEFVRANAKLQYSAAMSNEKGRRSERERLAREIHDTVGHSLTAILMRVRMLRFLIRSFAPKSDGAAAEVDAIEQALTATIADVRHEVSKLRETSAVQINWVIRWRSLCRNFAESTGVRVIINIPDLEVDLPNDIGLAVFRIMQEALTNAIRHGKATTVDVTTVHKTELGLLYIRISDNGVGAKKTTPGNGLSGIQERVRELRGEISWMTLPGKGFDIGVSLPLGETANGKNQNSVGGRPSGFPARSAHAAGE